MKGAGRQGDRQRVAQDAEAGQGSEERGVCVELFRLGEGSGRRAGRR